MRFASDPCPVFVQRLAAFAILLFLFCFSPFFAPPMLLLCVMKHLAENAERFFVFRKEYAQKKDRDRDRNDLFGGEGNPQKRKVTAAEPFHPCDVEKDSDAEHDVAPAVCDHPADEEAEQKTRIEDQLEDFLDPYLDFFFCDRFEKTHAVLLLSARVLC